MIKEQWLLIQNISTLHFKKGTCLKKGVIQISGIIPLQKMKSLLTMQTRA